MQDEKNELLKEKENTQKEFENTILSLESKQKEVSR